MQLESLGHQSWLVSNSTYSILIDPAILGRFGGSPLIYGKQLFRTMWLESANRPTAIVLTTHHADHFDVSSLSAIAKLFPQLPVITHRKMPKVAIEILKVLGFNIQFAEFNDWYCIGGIGLQFVRHYSGNYPWERTSASLFIRDDAIIYFQAEGDPKSLGFLSESSHLTVLTNNSQLRNGRRSGFFCNTFEETNPRTVMQSYYGILSDLSKEGAKASAIIYTGTDFCMNGSLVSSDAKFDEVHSNEIEQTLNALSNGVLVSLAKTAKQWSVRPKSVELVNENSIAVSSVGEWVSKNTPSDSIELSQIVFELNKYRANLLLSPLGRMLVNCHRFRGTNLGSVRLTIKLIRSELSALIVFDVNTGTFYIDKHGIDITYIPFGISVPWLLFEAVLRGEIGPWELSLHPDIEQWYIGRGSDSFLSFLASIFCPTVNSTNFLHWQLQSTCAKG
ncbi:hypothetical protein AM348_09145 [Citrobacter freundii]|nr:hypothetical protein AM348_09145 [Citrobacter freundii]AVD78154.1 hypothetical protein AM350_10955 [Citrobacter freundii]